MDYDEAEEGCGRPKDASYKMLDQSISSVLRDGLGKSPKTETKTKSLTEN